MPRRKSDSKSLTTIKIWLISFGTFLKISCFASVLKYLHNFDQIAYMLDTQELAGSLKIDPFLR
jgi:hypothetical protein